MSSPALDSPAIARPDAAARDAILLANVWDSVIVTDLEGVITYWNEGATRLFGWTAQEMLGQPCALRFPEPERSEVARWIERIAAGEAEFAGEWLDWRKDGSRVWIEVNTRLIRDGSGVPVGIMGISRDISDRKRTEAVILAAKEAAEAANRAKDRFLAVLSHELRTPLSPVVMSVAAMEMDPELPLRLREDVAMIRRNIELETKLIDDLLDLSRITSGKLRLQVQPTRVHDLLRHVVANCKGDACGEKRLHLRCELDAGSDVVDGDPARLQQVFWNVVRNAIKFTPEGGDVTVRTASDNGRLRVQVCDTGAGIPSQALPRIFDAFEQGEVTTARQYGGLGLGLAIARGVVEMHGGSIRAESAGPGQGATFTIDLPAAAVVAGPDGARTPEGNGDHGARGTRVLLVEDHADTARMLARLLQSSGYAVQTAGSVAAALELAAAQPFDVVVSDIGLPDATGYDLMRQIRQRHGLKGIALTGYGMEDDLRHSREAGFVEHVVKPVNVSQLETIIERVTGARG
jgi:two-component system CheB/CheR fusion protein